MLKKAIMVFVPVAAVFTLVLLLGSYSRYGNLFTGGRNVSTVAILHQVQTLSQLVTVKYVLEKVIVAEDAKWYGDNRVVLVAHGVVKAGVNLDNLQAGDLQISDKSVTLTLPHPDITDVYLDDHHTQIVERTTGLMRNFDKDLEQTARHRAVDDLRAAALSNGILKDAEDRAKAQLGSLFNQLGFTTVEFKSR